MPDSARSLPPSIERVMAGIDWISATLPIEAEGYQEWVGRAYGCLEVLRKEGNIFETRKMQGYEGHSVGNCFVGQREDGAFCQITGERADTFYKELIHPKVRIPRLDVQITVQTTELDETIGEEAFNAATSHDSQLPLFKRRNIDRWTSKNGGYTLYVGSASADKRLRLYNKSAQSEDVRYTRCWRYEVVLRNNHSDEMFRSIVSKASEATNFIVSYVSYFCRERGITIRNLEYVTPVGLVRVVEIPTDVERKLKWLAKQVKPTLRKLSELGYGDEAAEAMGLWIPKET
jgi:DNA relaxase NicK